MTSKGLAGLDTPGIDAAWGTGEIERSDLYFPEDKWPVKAKGKEV